MTAVERARPAGLYASFSQAGGLLHTSGVVGRRAGQVITGVLAGPQDVARGEAAAVAAVDAILRAIEDAFGGLAAVSRVVTLTGYLHSTGEFTQHVAVMNAASAALQRAFPDAPLPSRTTVGVASLPGGGVVEVSMVLALANPRDADGQRGAASRASSASAPHRASGTATGPWRDALAQDVLDGGTAPTA